MRYLNVVWNDEQGGNTEHVLEHGFTKADVEHVIENPVSEAFSDSSGRPCFFGYTPEGEYIIVVYEELDSDTIYPVTAYMVPEA